MIENVVVVVPLSVSLAGYEQQVLDATALASGICRRGLPLSAGHQLEVHRAGRRALREDEFRF